MTKHFRYDVTKYIAGLLFSVLTSVIVSLICDVICGESIFILRIEHTVVFTFSLLVPLLVFCSLAKNYWTPMLIFLAINYSFAAYVVLVLVPKPLNTTLFQHLLRCWTYLVDPIVVACLPAAFFQQYCKWVCCLPENKPGG